MNTTLKTLLTAGTVLAAVILAPIEAFAKGPSGRGHTEVRDRGDSRTHDRVSTPSTRSHTPSTRSHTPSTRSHTPSTRGYTPSTRSHTPSTRSHSPSTRGHTSGRDYDRTRHSTSRGHSSRHVTIDFGLRRPTTTYVLRTETVLVEAGHYELRTEEVLVEEAHWVERLIPESRQVIRDEHGRVVRIIIELERTEKVWVPDQFETRTVKVWIPPRYETRVVRVPVSSSRSVFARTIIGGISIGGIFRF